MVNVNELSLRRSIFFPTAEIYANSPSGFWEYGPVGSKIKRKVIDFWRKELAEKENALEISGSNLLPEAALGCFLIIVGLSKLS